MRILLLLPFFLASCNSTFVAKTKSGAEYAYTGSFASKASFDKTRITMASGATIDKEIHGKDEVEAVQNLANLALLKAGINAATSTTNNAIDAIPK